MAFRLGRWEHLRGTGSFAVNGEPTFAGVSGGRTSGMMAALCDRDVVLSFQNTGREHPKTYEFLKRLDDALDGRLLLLEFRKPLRKGDPPKESRAEVVTFETMDRTGAVLEDVLATLAEFRATQGKGKVAPWARSRICTAYAKHLTLRRYVASLGIETYTTLIGLRADEEPRVRALAAAETADRTLRTPLHRAGITKANVLEFWKDQTFDLELQEHQGNCTGCFLKDEGDLARVMLEPETDAPWWFRMEAEYPGFGGYDFRGYRALAAEGPSRLAIETALRRGGLVPPRPEHIPQRRYLNIVRQEERRMRGEKVAFSCACERSFMDDAEDA